MRSRGPRLYEHYLAFSRDGRSVRVAAVGVFKRRGLAIGGDDRRCSGDHFSVFLVGLLNGTIVDDFDRDAVVVGMTGDLMVQAVGFYFYRWNAGGTFILTVFQQIAVGFRRELRGFHVDFPRSVECALSRSRGGDQQSQEETSRNELFHVSLSRMRWGRQTGPHWASRYTRTENIAIRSNGSSSSRRGRPFAF